MTLSELARADLGTTRVWAAASVADRIRGLARRWTFGKVGEPLDCDTLIAVGGGALIDEAKAACRGDKRVTLVAIASLWGSGAETSPVVVLSRDGKKHIRLDSHFLPDIVVTWPELGETVDGERARRACGDVWAHAVEALFSPLASTELRRELAELIGLMLEMPLAYAPGWFELSARASALQARASVGLVHGMAHTLEMVEAAPRVGHAALSATLLAPVLDFDRRGSTWGDRLAESGLSEDRLAGVAGHLHEPRLYGALVPFIQREWRTILRDPCTRMNGTLVRPDALSHFTAFASAHRVA
jgi:alcohol dehydrogenase class IV